MSEATREDKKGNVIRIGSFVRAPYSISVVYDIAGQNVHAMDFERGIQRRRAHSPEFLEVLDGGDALDHYRKLVAKWTGAVAVLRSSSSAAGTLSDLNPKERLEAALAIRRAEEVKNLLDYLDVDEGARALLKDHRYRVPEEEGGSYVVTPIYGWEIIDSPTMWGFVTGITGLDRKVLCDESDLGGILLKVFPEGFGPIKSRLGDSDEDPKLTGYEAVGIPKEGKGFIDQNDAIIWDSTIGGA